MKFIILLLVLIGYAPLVAAGQKYKHKSEAEIAVLTPAQRVDEYANEQAYHKYDLSDDHSEIIRKYVTNDGLKALPRISEIINEYDPTRASGRSGRKGERFDGSWMLLGDLDDNVVRLRTSEEGRHAINALENAIERMRAAGYGQKDQFDWKRSGRFHISLSTLESIKSINRADEAIRDTLKIQYKIVLSDADLLEFSNYLTARHPEYPGWSKRISFVDYTRFNYAGNALAANTMRKPERFYESYLKFKKQNISRK